MAKKNTLFICSDCGNESTRSLYTCLVCKGVGTVKEQAPLAQTQAAATAGLKSAGAVIPVKPAKTLKELSGKAFHRTPTGINEFDRVLGGGYVESEVVLFAGHPGAGKSTLALAIANAFALQGKKVLYSSGEESEQQIWMRAKRLGIDSENILITNEVNLETLQGHIATLRPDFIIVDSLQTIASTEIAGSTGSVSQSKEAAHVLTRIAKSENIMMLLINQIIKSGEFAGSESIQHIVDCSLIFESDQETPLKFLRAVKNRFGQIDEVGVFQHGDKGLEEVSDPSGVFIEEDTNSHGTACSFISEGVRQIPIEVQALVSSSPLPTPRKQFSGVVYTRAQIVCAVLDKFCGTKLFDKDVFINTVSGLKVQDTQADLSIAAALLSSSKEVAFGDRTMFIGELSLTGHVRGGFMVEGKIREAERLGFDRVIIPQNALKNIDTKKFKIKIEAIGNVKELKNFLPS